MPGLTEKLCKRLQEVISNAVTLREQPDVSFIAHFDLVSIHPFYDGNGRTSRLLMNFIQQLFDLPLSIVFTEDKAAYYEVLQQTREIENIAIFLQFMYSQYHKYLLQEITNYQQINKGHPDTGKRFSFVF